MRPIITLAALVAASIPALAHADTPAIVATEPGITLEVAPAVTTNHDPDDPDAGTGGTVRVRAGYRTGFGLEPFVELLPLVLTPAKDGAPGLLAIGLRQSLQLGKLVPHLDVALATDGDLTGAGNGLVLGVTAGVDYQLGERLTAGVFASYYTGARHDLSVVGAAVGWRF